MPIIPAYHRHFHAASPRNDLPEGTLSLTQFILAAGVPYSIATRHVWQGLGIERMSVTTTMRYGRVVCYVTPDQQRAAFEFWDKHGIKYRKPVLALEVEASS